jgi:hypothetical protein
VLPYLTLILTAWEFKKPFCKNETNPGWLRQNIFLKIINALQKSEQTFIFQKFSLKMSFSVCF